MSSSAGIAEVNRRNPSARVSVLQVATTGVLLLLSALILSLFLADAMYVSTSSIAELFTSEDIRSAIVLTLVTSTISTVFALLFAIPAAYALSRFSIPGRAVLDTLVDLLLVVPVLVVGVSILVLLRNGAQFAGSSFMPLAAFGAFFSWISDMVIYQRPGIVVAQFFCSVPFAVRMMKSTFDTIDPRTEAVAQTLGCTAGGAFFSVCLPLASKGVIAAAILSWSRAFGLFGPVSLVAGAVRRKTEVMATSIFLEISIGRLEVALAISLLMIVTAFGILLTVRLLTKEKTTRQGMSS